FFFSRHNQSARVTEPGNLAYSDPALRGYKPFFGFPDSRLGHLHVEAARVCAFCGERDAVPGGRPGRGASQRDMVRKRAAGYLLFSITVFIGHQKGVFSELAPGPDKRQFLTVRRKRDRPIHGLLYHSGRAPEGRHLIKIAVTGGAVVQEVVDVVPVARKAKAPILGFGWWNEAYAVSDGDLPYP